MTLFNLKNVGWIGSLGIITEFASLYESFQDLTVLQKQHFVEWFSGKDIDSIWTKRSVTGVPTFAMDDVVDGGFKITTAATSLSQGIIDFNNIRHYSNIGSILLGVSKTVFGQAAGSQHIGFAGTTGSDPINSAHVHSNADIEFMIRTKDATTASNTSFTTAFDEAFHGWKVEVRASDVLGFIDGVQEVTKTTNLPTTKMMPFAGVNTGSATPSADTFNIRYLEAFNT